MWGEGLRWWHEFFAGIAVFRATADGHDDNEGWIHASTYEDRFRSDGILVDGRCYDPKDQKQRNLLIDAIISNAGVLCHLKLLERRRPMIPPSLDYRVTKFGRRIDGWGYGEQAEVRKRLLFLAFELYLRGRKHRKIITIGAAGWGIVNAFKFYTSAFDWIRNDLFSAISALIMAGALWIIYIFIKFER
jgi:hypothetical protein